MEKLTKAIHVELQMQGYKFFLLKDVSSIDAKIPACYIVQPVRLIPAHQEFSCLGLNDEMISSILNGDISHVVIYLASR